MDEGASQVVLVLKNLPASEEDMRDMGLTPGSGRSPGGGHGNPLSMLAWRVLWTKGTLQATVHSVSKVGHN